MTIRNAAFAGLLALLLPGCGAEASCTLAELAHARVQAVDDADTLKLEDGRFLRLTGIQGPKNRPDIPGFATWPLAAEAEAALAALAAPGTMLTLKKGGATEDRHGRMLAHAFAAGADGREVWVQGEMVLRGWARVYTFADNPACAAELLAREGEARAARRGIWADPFYAVRTPETAGRDLDSFQLVEGQVTEAAEVRGRVFLNFGADYRTDFTVTVAPEDRKAFSRAPYDLTALAGRTLRVRGWVSERNGPQIEATHPEQIELLD